MSAQDFHGVTVSGTGDPVNFLDRLGRSAQRLFEGRAPVTARSVQHILRQRKEAKSNAV